MISTPTIKRFALLPDCTLCIKGYGRSLNNCHSCDGTAAQLLVMACALFSLAIILLLILAVVFVVGGLDAVNLLRQSMMRKISRASKHSDADTLHEKSPRWRKPISTKAAY